MQNEKSLLKPKINSKAQTATELAVFGAILIFMIGTIVKQSLGYSMTQNQMLKAFRLAMLTSHRYSEGLGPVSGLNPGQGVASRNSASVVFVEDRLSADSSKYGAVDRVPYVLNGSATHSRNLFMPIDADESFNLPVIDVFVNGKQFPFTVAKIKWVTFGPVNNSLWDTPEYSRIQRDWDPNCAHKRNDATQMVACQRLYMGIPNSRSSAKWCDTDDPLPPPPPPPPPIIPDWRTCAGKNNLTADERFDLDRTMQTNPLVAATSNVPFPPSTFDAERKIFAWQWYLIKAYDERKISFAGFEFEQTAVLEAPGEGINIDAGKNVQADVDGDLKDETILATDLDVDPDPNNYVPDFDGVIHRVQVMDFQDGDVDFAQSDPAPGFTNDVQMYTYVSPDGTTNGGTYLQVDEGKLFSGFGDTRQYVRNVQKKDSIDIVQRVFRLSNNTKRFCDSSYNPKPSPLDGDIVPNPVEVCCKTDTTGSTICNGSGYVQGCFGDNSDKICLQVQEQNAVDQYGTPYVKQDLLLFIRSRVRDLHGRKWVTDVGQDDYVDFQRDWN